MGEVIRNGDSIALAGDSSPPYLLGEGGKGKGGEGRSIFRLLVENDFEVGKWVLERYRKEGAGGKTGEKQGKGGWEAFLLEIDQQGEGKLLDFFRELVREELERDCSTPLRAASPVTHFFAIFLELFPLDFLWKILKKMGKRIQIQGSKTLDIMEEVSNDPEKLFLVSKCMDEICTAIRAYLPNSLRKLLQICLSEYQKMRDTMIAPPQKALMSDEKCRQWIFCITLLYFVTPSLLDYENHLSPKTAKTIKRNLSRLPLVMAIVLQKGASDSEQKLPKFQEYSSGRKSLFADVASNLCNPTNLSTNFFDPNTFRPFSSPLTTPLLSDKSESSRDSLSYDNPPSFNEQHSLSFSSGVRWEEEHCSASPGGSPLCRKRGEEGEKGGEKEEGGGEKEEGRGDGRKFSLTFRKTSPYSPFNTPPRFSPASPPSPSCCLRQLPQHSSSPYTFCASEGGARGRGEEEEEMTPPKRVVYSLNDKRDEVGRKEEERNALRQSSSSGDVEGEGGERGPGGGPGGRERRNSRRSSKRRSSMGEEIIHRVGKLWGVGEGQPQTNVKSAKTLKQIKMDIALLSLLQRLRVEETNKQINNKKKEEATKTKNEFNANNNLESVWCSRCSNPTSNPQVCENCLSQFCSTCFLLSPLKNPCPNGFKHKYSLSSSSTSTSSCPTFGESPKDIPTKPPSALSASLLEQDAAIDCFRCSKETKNWRKCEKCGEKQCLVCQGLSVLKNFCSDGRGHHFVKEVQEASQPTVFSPSLLLSTPKPSLPCARCSALGTDWSKCQRCLENFCRNCQGVSRLKFYCQEGRPHLFMGEGRGEGGEEGGEESLLFFDKEYLNGAEGLGDEGRIQANLTKVISFLLLNSRTIPTKGEEGSV